jgi:hypothetical protein
MWDRIKAVKWGAVLIENNELSMGRLMCWVVFGAHIWFWAATKAVPNTMFDILLVLFAYNFGKKLSGPLAEIMRGRLGARGSQATPIFGPAAPAAAPTAAPTAALVPQISLPQADSASTMPFSLARAEDVLRPSPPKVTFVDSPFVDDRTDDYHE